MSKQNEMEAKGKKRGFEDYAFRIATVLCIVPIIVGVLIATLTDGVRSIHRWWPFSWMFFMFGWSACEIKGVVDIKLKRGIESAGDDLEHAAEHALYIVITTIMLLVGIIEGEFYSSWLAGPIVFVLLAVICPLLRNRESKDQSHFPAILLIVLLIGIVTEVVVGGWVAFPVSWILISAVKLYKSTQKIKFTEDFIVDIAYNVLSIILLSISLIWGSWIISWLAYSISVIIGKGMCRIKSKTA